ncbi:formate dehydrogenase-O domain protein [Mycobacterium ulcerans str. Harvey]|uniref:Formate dehydrogenase-O domain protein n=1 Tax=Mycobacterium ulcerans str. Harvey TaxID=1299332 RepID=A0ABN0QPS1_MYCUL|nr:formate dehydrogenase-O domain protein [Mycobacterium ulcerans str. Harvey]
MSSPSGAPRTGITGLHRRIPPPAGITTETGTHLDTTRDDGIAHPDPEESP